MSDDSVSLSNFITRLKDKVLSFNFLKVVFIVVLGIVLLYVVSNVYVSNDDNVNALTFSISCGSSSGSAGPSQRTIPSGEYFIIPSASVNAGTTVTLHPLSKNALSCFLGEP